MDMLATLSSGGQQIGFVLAALVFCVVVGIGIAQRSYAVAGLAAGLVVLAATWALIAGK